jgi:DNA-directed RNA polymerase subunit RPC12/RpoP
MHDPHYTYVRPKVSLKKFIKSINVDSQGNIIFYLSLMSFSIYLAAPFFTPYVLQTLNFSYFYYVILFSLPYFVRLFFTKRIGMAVDRFGPKKILKLTSFLLVLTPILWLINDSFIWLMFVQMYAGLIYGTYEISSLSFFVNETNSSNRVSFFAYFNFIRGFFIILGALLSNIALKFGPFDIGFLNAFFWSAIFRFLVLFVKFPKKVKEKDRYLPSSYGLLSRNMFLLTTPKEMMSKLVAAKEMLQTKVINRNDIVTRLGTGEMVKIKRQANIVSNVKPGLKIKKEDTKDEQQKPRKKSQSKILKPTHAVYFCTACDAEFRRDLNSRTKKKCPYCGHEKIFFMRHDKKRRSFSFINR